MTTTYKWEGLDTATGKLRTGRVAAADEDAARLAAQNAGAIPVTVRPTRDMMGRLSHLQFGSRRATPTERASFYRTLALAAATEAQLEKALGSARLGLKKRSRLRPSLDRILQELSVGKTPQQALESESAVLGSEAAAVYSASERSSTPEHALEELSEIVEQAGQIAAGVRSALIQPAVMTCFAGLAGVVMMVYVMPSLSETFEEFGGELPLLTRIFVGMSGFMAGNIATLMLVALSAVIAGAALLRRDDVRLAASYASQRVPIVGSITTAMNTQRICALMGVMLSAGVPHRIALTTCADAVASTSVRVRLTAAATDVREHPFPEVIGNHLASLDPALQGLAEQSESGLADPGSNWSRYGQFLRRDTERRVSGMTTALKPIMGSVIGGGIGLMIIAFYLPMFGVFETISNGSGL